MEVSRRAGIKTRYIAFNFMLMLSSLSCGETPTGNPADGALSLQVVTAFNVDTIGSTLVSPLRVRLLRGNKPLRDTELEFYAATGTSIGADKGLLQDFVAATTDSHGEVVILGRNRSQAGTHKLVVSAPAFSFSDSIDITVLPGKSVRVIAFPSDTSAYPNTNFGVRANAVDQSGNAREDVVTYEGSGINITVGPAGRITTGAIGRGFVVVRSGGFADTAWVSVVPPARLIVAHAALTTANDPPGGWYLIETDGTILEKILDFEPAEAVGTVSPDGTRFIFQVGDIYDAKIYDYRFTTRALSELMPGNVDIGWPEFTRDGQWIVFQKAEVASQGAGVLYRMSATGGVPQRIPTGSGDYLHDIMPSNSPDGQMIVYASNRDTPSYSVYEIRTIDLRTNQIKPLNVQGVSPRWSPKGDLIAIVAPGSEVKVMRTDGSDLRTISPPGAAYAPGLRWSSDGAWVVATRLLAGGATELQILSADGRHVLPLFSGRLNPRQAVWMP
jgi:hypothetical protein